MRVAGSDDATREEVGNPADLRIVRNELGHWILTKAEVTAHAAAEVGAPLRRALGREHKLCAATECGVRMTEQVGTPP
jgi:hypothetical protein